MLQRTQQPVETLSTDGAAARLYRRTGGAFTLFVVLPTLIVALYLSLFASSQYRSEASFIIRSVEPRGPSMGGIGQLLGMAAPLSAGQSEAQNIREYLLSMDVIPALKARGIDLVQVYRRPGTDPVFRLWFENPRAETLLDYYRSRVDVTYSTEDDLTRMEVRAFAPQDAQRMANALLDIGEARVNAFNARVVDAGMRLARAEMIAAEQELAGVQARITGLRSVNRDVDPQASGLAEQRDQQERVASVDRQRALLADMERQLAPDSPQIAAMRARLRALEQSLGAVRGRIAGAPGATSNRVGAYEELRLRQDFAAKRYEAARATLEEARVRAEKDRLFVVPVVNPNLPEKPWGPRPIRTTLIVFACLSLAYGIAYLVIAGIREHQS
ncbi:lipopolysaccharide biosynthesis protein [Sphingomonas sp. CJ99]